ncbi:MULTISPECIES: hypothetical protein [Stenotrophomonas]|uniref:hypothetical protein n=1 Tax=Stenotrophomonas TaxID=40323 RepID=UPI000B756474|nr:MULTISPECIES: hypothetical protein [Stenotrophomonas]SMR83014.1 hypothetical protein SAMN04487863_3739 [Stenotrophomonas sp. yr243]SNT48851.1 hypothetical protein SAMN05518671_2356 [Stenotrophomonas lactitubi]
MSAREVTALKRLGLAALLLAPVTAVASAAELTPVQAFDLYAQVIVHGDAAAQATLAGYLDTDNGPALAAALAGASHLDEAPELADWPKAAAALRKRQTSVHCTIDSVRHAQADSAYVDYRCYLPDLSALLPVYRQHSVPFNGPHPPQMARELATAYTQMMAVAPDRERIITVSFKRDHDGGPWHVQNPTPLMSGLADAFLPFFEWNEHLPN